MNVQQIGERVVTFVEEVFVKFGARDDFAPMERQIFENGVLTRRQRYRLSGARDGAGAGVDQHIGQFDFWPRLAGGATDQRPQPR
jgi:hypothetical protein